MGEEAEVVGGELLLAVGDSLRRRPQLTLTCAHLGPALALPLSAHTSQVPTAVLSTTVRAKARAAAAKKAQKDGAGGEAAAAPAAMDTDEPTAAAEGDGATAPAVAGEKKDGEEEAPAAAVAEPEPTSFIGALEITSSC